MSHDTDKPTSARENQACEVPLIEQLRDIPKDYRTERAIQWSDDGRETGHQFIPVGFMMHRAADELEALQRALAAEMPQGEALDMLARVVEAHNDYGTVHEELMDEIKTLVQPVYTAVPIGHNKARCPCKECRAYRKAEADSR